jgi:hypothetical protein
MNCLKTFFEIIPAVRQLPPMDKLRLIRILAEELDNGESSFPFMQNKTYYLATPYNSFGAAEILADALAASKGSGN